MTKKLLLKNVYFTDEAIEKIIARRLRKPVRPKGCHMVFSYLDDDTFGVACEGSCSPKKTCALQTQDNRWGCACVGSSTTTIQRRTADK
jgi:hypothetical protein